MSLFKFIITNYRSISTGSIKVIKRFIFSINSFIRISICMSSLTIFYNLSKAYS
jgi:hypothetical protein